MRNKYCVNCTDCTAEDSKKGSSENICKPSGLPALPVSINCQNEVSIDRQDDTRQSAEHPENLPVNRQMSKATAEEVLYTDVEIVIKTIEIPEYRLILEHSTVDSVESVVVKITDIIEFEMADKIVFLKIKTIRSTFPSNLCQTCYF